MVATVKNLYKHKYVIKISHPETKVISINPEFYGSIYPKEPTRYIFPNPPAPRFITPADYIGQYFDYRIEALDSIEITDLQMKADISYEKDVRSAVPQQAIIKLYNLSNDTQKRIKEEGTISIKAGYETDTDLPLLFMGQIVKKSVQKDGENTITTLYCGDSYTVKKTFRHAETFYKGNTFRQNLERIYAISASAGVPKGVDLPPDDPQLDKKSSKGWYIYGRFFEQITKLCSDIGYRAYTAMGVLYIEPRSKGFRLYDTIEITPDNIKGSLKSLSDSSTNFTTENDKLGGVKFTTFLDGRITPEIVVSITGRSDDDGSSLSGNYFISSLSHKLDYEGSTWDTEVECKETASA